jgi:formylglycine-generating enzyme required for sulfatase activity
MTDAAHPDPRDALIAALRVLEQQVQRLRANTAGVNNPTFEKQKDTLLAALTVANDLLAVHIPQPRRRLVRGLDGLFRAVRNLRLPALPEDTEDPDYHALETLSDALGGLRTALDNAQDQARIAYPGVPRIGDRMGSAGPAVAQVLAELTTFETAMRELSIEAGTAPSFQRQGELVTGFVKDMKFSIGLNRLLLRVNTVTLDLGALVDALETTLELSEDFRSCVTAWFGEVTQDLFLKAWDLDAPLRRLVAGVKDLGGMIEPDAEGEFAASEPDMVLIRPGTFVMGISEEETKAHGWEYDKYARPQHTVVISRLFLLGRYPVTVGEYAEFAQETGRTPQPPEFPQNDRHPAVNVSWEDAMAYCEWLSDRTGLAYRLPSEAEWEYACRGGTVTARWWGDAFDPKMANLNSTSTSEVDAFPANPWGLHDMLGNVSEWCADPWHEDYKGAPSGSAAWTTGGSDHLRVVRGGSWVDLNRNNRSGYRGRFDRRSLPWVGFRLARTL